MRDKLLILSVFIVASCGLAYELIAGALASYLLGDSIFQFSSIIGCYLFAMGIGSHISKYVPERRTLDTFIEIELLVGLIGGLSATLLFVIFAWASAPFRSVLYALVFITGTLVGMEIPLVMRVLNQRQTAFNDIVSRVLTFDYMGALAVSLLFPLVLAPHLGLARSALLFGLINVGIALMTTRIFRKELIAPNTQMMRGGIALLVLTGAMFSAEHLTRWSEKSLYGDEIIHAQTTQYQRLLITQWKNDTRLYINGNLQFSSRDEYRYHEALVHPVLAKLPQARRVLVLGGGDGLAVREILKYANIEQITLVDLDPVMTDLFTHNAKLTGLNQHALSNPKVKVVNADAAQWIEQNQDIFDAIIIDFPDPSNFALGKLYSVPMYRLVMKHLSENGLMVVQSTSPLHAPYSYWCINATLQSVGLYTHPYHAFVPSFGEWGFILASKKTGYTPPTSYSVAMKFLDAETTRQMFFFPPDMQPVKTEVNQLNNQSLVHYFEQDWSKVIR
ncbi:polyamine aminopropyltransferase [Deefgea rivuli]|uniref:polyamine aminopropyltransferase n=1 Tax=Deefgea rivuli TaxID=400948 RepID=UPI0004885CF3|nr:polyamine aminopropyltransferase [Deefgea rivuli]